MWWKRITRVEFPAGTISPTQPPPTKRVAAYARVSTMKDAQENSLQSQPAYFTEYIQRHPGWVFARMYADDGISGLSICKRDGFNSTATDALDGKIDLILTKFFVPFRPKRCGCPHHPDVYIYDWFFDRRDKSCTKPQVVAKILHYKIRMGRTEANNGGDEYSDDVYRVLREQHQYSINMNHKRHRPTWPS